MDKTETTSAEQFSQPRLREPRIWASVIRGLILPMEELQLAPHELLAECDISPDALEKMQRSVPIRKYLQFLNLAAERADQPLIGLHLSRSAGPEMLGVLGFLFMSSQTLATALSQFCSYINLLQDVTHTRLSQDSEHLAFSYDIAPIEGQSSRVDVEFSLALMCRLIRMYAGSSISIECVRFRHAPAAPKSEYQRLMRTDVSFEQAENVLVLPASASQIKGHQFNPELANVLIEMLDEQLARQSQVKSLAEQVYDELFFVKEMSPPPARMLATSLGVSEATFHRRLRREGTSFGEIVDRRRFELAKEYLADQSLETTRIAHLIGFSESASFTRAFRRWSDGQTPTSFRNAIRKAKDAGRRRDRP
ncbi:MAG: hypothetical protein A3E78_10520 [Alphaproteobacteria bacterium RIFCSPHIGHO2_12_FULL_63_12]|nr:MAG: hypothetical protein A3E78_10520 [Alphaproteobacteria bacterium RIFCSPHIGHO2_12_FULL_63_12]